MKARDASASKNNFYLTESLKVVVLVVEEDTDEVEMGGKCSWGDGSKPS